MMANDLLYMGQALELARKGMGTVTPNPLVGAVVVKNNRVIATGYHAKAGGPHAEVVAINNAKEDLEGATLYCSLEPCCHHNKRTPPCTELIIEKKFSRVVVASLDPNPEVSGRGITRLKEAGIIVDQGVLEEEALDLNRVFTKYITTSLPYVHLKVAMTLDGRIADSSGDSKWITDEFAREEVHILRYMYDGVMIGRKTLNRDDPSLTIRHIDSQGKVPMRIIVGNINEMKLDSRLFTDEYRENTLVFSSESPVKSTSLVVREFKNLAQVLKELGEMKITSVLVEGGSRLHSQFINERLFDRLTVYISPVILGNGPSFYEDLGRKMETAIRGNAGEVSVVGNQVRLDLDREDFA